MTNETTNETHEIDYEDHDDLEGKQREFLEAVLQSTTGLFVLAAVAGAGKSYTLSRTLAEIILRRFANGAGNPVGGVVAMSFGRDDAADIIPDTISWLEFLVATDATPAARSVGAAELEKLKREVRSTDTIGTVDSVLRQIFADIAPEIGYDEPPNIGADGATKTLHDDIVDQLQADKELAPAIEHLENAYPAEDGEKIYDHLREALDVCRQQRLSVEDLHRELRESLEAVYPAGPPEDFNDILDDVEQFAGSAAAAEERDLTDDEKEDLVEADATFYVEWCRCIEEFTEVYRQYEDLYDERSRELGIASHTDCAYLVTAYFTDNIDSRWRSNDIDEAVIDRRRERLRKRWQSRFSTVFIDECQDISQIQHEAITTVVDEDTRIVAGGDLKQLIYQWRDVNPSIFARAMTDGMWAGIDWDNPVVKTTNQSFRHAEPVADAINGLVGPSLTDDTRGHIADTSINYEPLDATRPGTTSSHVHLPTFRGSGIPYQDCWVSTDGEDLDEPDVLTHYLDNGLNKGKFRSPPDASNTDPTIMAIFQKKRWMGLYADKFRAAGFDVVNEAEPLTSSRIVAAVFDILEWLARPFDPGVTESLLMDSTLIGADERAPNIESVETHVFAEYRDQFEDCSWDIATIADDTDVTDEHYQLLLDGLAELEDKYAWTRSADIETVLWTVVSVTGLVDDPLGTLSSVDRAQRLHDVQMLIDALGTTADAINVGIEQVYQVREHWETGTQSPSRPVITDDYDVLLTTTWRAKGDEEDIVVLADPSANVHTFGYDGLSLLSDGTVAIPPPETTAASDMPAIPGYDNGLLNTDPCSFDYAIYAHDYVDSSRDAGLRWISHRFRDDVDLRDDRPPLVGPARLVRSVTARRAEHYRELYVAATRARDHLVIPMYRDRYIPGIPQDRWSTTLRERLQFETDAPIRGTYRPTLTTPTGTTVRPRVSVNDIDAELPTRYQRVQRGTHADEHDAGIATRDIGRSPGDAGDWFAPRRLYASSAFDVLDNPADSILQYLLGEQLDPTSGAVDPDVSLPFNVLDPATVGTVSHRVIEKIVSEDLSATTPSDVDPVINNQFRKVARDHDLPTLPNEEAEAVREYLNETILPQLEDTALYERLSTADGIHTETPLEATAEVNGYYIDILGQADYLLIIDIDENRRHIEDIKITFTDPSKQTEKRHKLQLSNYKWALEKLEESNVTVTARITYLGEVQKEISNIFDSEVIEYWIQKSSVFD